MDAGSLKGLCSHGHIYVQAEAAKFLSSVVLSLHAETSDIVFNRLWTSRSPFNAKNDTLHRLLWLTSQ